MTTLRRIERLWDAKAYPQLLAELLSARPEASPRLHALLERPAAVAALALLRMDELNQPQGDLGTKLVEAILQTQEADGGWGDAPLTALCVRALTCDSGRGLAIDRGLPYLAMLQRPDHLWPAVPMRRMPADPYVSAFVLYCLGHEPRFAAAVRLEQTLDWFEAHWRELDALTLRLWQAVRRRCPRGLHPVAA